MIPRSDLVEQFKEYQIRSKSQWSTLSFLSATSSSPFPSKVDKIAVVLQRLVISCIAFSGFALYFRYIRFALYSIIITILILTWMRITKKTRLNKKNKRNTLLPLSM